MVCNKCGAEAPEGSVYCAKCGTKLGSEAGSTDAAETSGQQAGSAEPEQTAERRAVATVKSDMYQHPDPSSHKVARIYRGDILRIIGEEEGFCQATLESGFSQGTSGYVLLSVLSEPGAATEGMGRRTGGFYPLGRSDAIEARSLKNPGLALVLSLVWSGIGQIYNGEVGKGVGLLIAYGFSLVLMMAIIGFITTPIIWIYGMVDAYKTAERLNQNIVGPQKRCPYCAELIQAQAKVCRFCGRDVTAAGTAQSLSGQPGSAHAETGEPRAPDSA